MSPDSMTSGWYYAKAGAPAGREIGPLSWEDLYVLAQGGTVGPSDIVWNPKLPRGVAARLIPGLIPATETPEAPPVHAIAQPIVPQPAPVPAPQPVVSEPAPVSVPQPVVPQPVVPQPVVPQPVVPQPVVPQWDVTPEVAQTPVSATAPTTDSEVPDLFASKLGETGAPDILHDEPEPPRAKKQNRNLPWLVMLLILVIAIAGVAAYFLYFRGTDDTGGGDQTTSTSTATSATVETDAPVTGAGLWTKLPTSGDVPAARSYHAMAYDPTADRTVLFGGSNQNGKFDDTWTFTLASRAWTKVAAGNAPSARDYTQMVYDPEGGSIILFGGSDDSEDRNDLWAFNTAAGTWTELQPAGILPQAREGHGMAYDPNTKRVLVFGGLSGDTGELLNDLWAYDPASNTWANLDPPGALPAERELAGMAYCPGSQRVLLFGGLTLGDSADIDLGDMWAYDPIANSWMELMPAGTAPASRQGHAIVAAPALGGLLMFGGLRGDNGLDETWLFDSLTDRWSQLQPAGQVPGTRDGHALVYDAASGTVTLFGGFDPATSLELADVWVYGPSPSKSGP